ncbi:hypothetical protein E3N88_13751 [Mikania micrantha]|uniref:EF-hand domain-containing protein n=1 Tax=Mikania micrantha TaxID=192012 RepID=A0A5N6P163_9ASTR|nr:hypothetical protein E3N88_13751 [Mikania micrantha]
MQQGRTIADGDTEIQFVAGEFPYSRKVCMHLLEIRLVWDLIPCFLVYIVGLGQLVVRIGTNPSAVADANRNGEDCGGSGVPHGTKPKTYGWCKREEAGCKEEQDEADLTEVFKVFDENVDGFISARRWRTSKPDMTNQWCLLLQRCKPASELLQCKITSYLEAILDVGSGLDDAKSSLLLREARRLIPTLDSMKLISSVLEGEKADVISDGLLMVITTKVVCLELALQMQQKHGLMNKEGKSWLLWNNKTHSSFDEAVAAPVVVVVVTQGKRTCSSGCGAHLDLKYQLQLSCIFINYLF